MKKDLQAIILTGVPGSGKSTYKRHNFPDAPSYSADDMMERKGTYQFDFNLLDLAHDTCLRDVTRSAFLRVEPVVVVDNTNTSLYEILPYIRVLEAHSYRIRVVNIVCDPAIAAARCIHGVPEDKIIQMHDRLMVLREELPKIADRFRKSWEFTDYRADDAA